MRLFILLFIFSFGFMAMPVSAKAASINCDKARSSADVMRCLTRENDQAQADLNKAFDTLSMQKTGEALTEVKDVQAQWINYRDLNCAQETANLETESLVRLESLRCTNRLTHERIRAIENSLTKDQEVAILGEATTQPRWMNALAEDFPNTYWRYGSRIVGDMDCDGDLEYVMSGMRQTKSAGLQPVISISENPLTGRPDSALIPLPLESPVSEAETAVKCGLLASVSFSAMPVTSVEVAPVEGVEALQCANHISISTANCPPRVIQWDGARYELKD